MNKDAIFEFVKKNIVSLCCGGVAIACIILLFYPLGGMVEDLTTQATAHAQVYQTLMGLERTRKQPMSDPYATDPGDLPGIIPNAATIAAGNRAKALWKQKSELMLSIDSKLNEQGHQMLVPDELPTEMHETTPFHFAQVYRAVLSSDPAKTGIGDPQANPPILPDPTLAAPDVKALNLVNDVLHGGLPPTAEEIDRTEERLKKDVYEPRIITVNGKPMNLVQLNSEYKAEISLLPRRMKAEVARKYKIYVEKDAFALNPTITPDQRSPIQDIWYAQMQLWMQQDLATAIAEANSSSTNILDAMVKRLILVQVPTPDKMYVLPPPTAGPTAGPGNLPAPGTDTTAYPPNYTVSVTGRYSNGMYDVVRFGLVVDVDAARVNQFIETLSNKRLITVTDENEYAIDPESEAANGYLYGSAPVVRLQLGGEMLFLRDWTSKLMPLPVKATLGLTQPSAGTNPPGTPMSPHFMGGGMGAANGYNRPAGR